LILVYLKKKDLSDVKDLSLPGIKEGSWNPLNSLELPLYCISNIIIIIVFPKKVYTEKKLELE